MYDWNKPFAREECRKFLVGDPLCREATQQRGRYQDDTDLRVRQTPVDGAHQRHAKANVFFAEPYPDTTCFKQIVQLFGGSQPVIPGVAEENVPKIGLLR